MIKIVFLISIFLTTSLFAKETLFVDAPADIKRKNPQNSDLILSYHNSIKSVKHSVVNISTTKKVKISQELEQFMQHPLFREFFSNRYFEQKNRKTHSLGSGVIVTDDGYILTNNHVVNGADEILVTLNGDNKEYLAKLIGSDPKTDIAVIKIDGKKFDEVKFADSSKVKEGDIVFALGNPFGVGSSITQGIVSALNKSRVGINRYEDFIQTDASINPGNSGGALVDSRGALIGINSAILSKSGGNNGIGFAIPSNMAKNIAYKLIEHGEINRGYLGVSISDLTSDLKDIYKSSHGAVIVNIVKESAADISKLQRGDLITSINGKKIKNADELKNKIASFEPNTTIEITYEREKKQYTLSLLLGDQENTQIPKSAFIQGLSLKELDDNIRERLRIPNTIQGILVTDVEFNSYAYKFGFIKGDIIIQIENHEIKNIKDIKTVMRDKREGAKRVYVNRNGYIIIIVIKNRE